MKTDYTIGELAALSGVSQRTLRHYEAKGLLAPRRQANGYRVYGSKDVERLQQVLLYRACGLSLETIRALLDDPAHDEAAVLRKHVAALEQRQRDLARLIGTVRKTIDHLEGRRDMTDKERFEGLPAQWVAQNEERYGAEARERYGDEAVDASNGMVLSMSAEDQARFRALSDEVFERLRAAMATGDPAGSEAARLCEAHRDWLCMTWPADAYSLEAHRGLGQLYVVDERFQRYYDGPCGAGAAAFLRDALDAWEG
ncbi:MerR family transcriptional regulator [Olsenella sp. YH-ols2217]|uniref:MerR family transcriptional regulator n=1 Tax=Kribbibacterium absianum TaxID=3044210 RepID=A0ABT6ZKU1_9ACTN|nr:MULTISPECIES: MerR family transcriptional regulator [unclassified Olsenella]MDJ1122548.1 MerR family transcriptional regulator [Olsenella sp. YH-ols2216]MDJ1129492.1 MerR family transcriptional regulator [Olsenella sp. YH-ols2217]